jgi:hypothetical protein
LKAVAKRQKVQNTLGCSPLLAVPLNIYYLSKGFIMNDKDLIEALRREGKMSGKNTPINKAADRLAELTQPQPIETAPREADIKLFGGAFSILRNDYSDETYGDWPNNFATGITGHFYPPGGAWVGSYDGIRTVINKPTHWLPCVKVDPASLGGQVDEE